MFYFLRNLSGKKSQIDKVMQRNFLESKPKDKNESLIIQIQICQSNFRKSINSRNLDGFKLLIFYNI